MSNKQRVQKSMDDQAAEMADLMLKGGAAGDMPESRKKANGGMAALAGGKEIDSDTEKGGYGMFAPAMGGTAVKPPKTSKAMGKGGKPFEGKETPEEEAAEAKMKKAKKGFEDGEGEERDDADDGDVEKSAHTGADVTNEPGRQGRKPRTGSAITSEPEESDGSDQSGEGAGLETDADEDPQHRKRKPGQVGVPDQESAGGEPGSGPGTNLDQSDDNMARKRLPGQVGVGKSAAATIDADALIKSLETLEAIAEGSTVAAPADRRAELAEKLADGTLSKSEMQELHALTGAAADADPLAKGGEVTEEVAKSFQEQFGEDADLQKGYEVSDFLERHSQVTAAALDQIQTTLAKSLDSHRDRTQSFNVALAKSLKGMAQLAQSQEALIKAMSTRLEKVETTPLPRKGVSTTRTLQKSLDGEVGGGDNGQLTRNQLMDGLESMAKSGKDVTPQGHRIDMAIAMLENGGGIAKSLYNDIAQHIEKVSGRVAVS